MLYGNHMGAPIRREIGLSRFQGVTYGLRAKGCYTDTQRGPASYTETIYTLLGRFNRLITTVIEGKANVES